jgi:hypothetical protein
MDDLVQRRWVSVCTVRDDDDIEKKEEEEFLEIL